MAEVDPAMPVPSRKLLPLVELRCKDRFPGCVSHLGSPYQLQVRSAGGLGRATVSEYKGRVLIVQSYRYRFVEMTDVGRRTYTYFQYFL